MGVVVGLKPCGLSSLDGLSQPGKWGEGREGRSRSENESVYKRNLYYIVSTKNVRMLSDDP